MFAIAVMAIYFLLMILWKNHEGIPSKHGNIGKMYFYMLFYTWEWKVLYSVHLLIFIKQIGYADFLK